MAATRLLIRTTVLDDDVLGFADELAATSGCPVSFVVDERTGEMPRRGRDVVGLSFAACATLGLHCPPDFTWKCGDYGYYVARDRHRDAERFWMIEYDVRFAGGDVAGFFAFFDRVEADFIAPYLVPASRDWFWTRTLRARDVRPYRCLFPVTRISARGIDLALAKRVQHSRNPFRRLVWPNDEAFVATTLVQAGLDCRDFNDFGRVLYTEETFSFNGPIRGDTFDPRPDGVHLYHPVLYGDAYDRKVARLEQPPFEMPVFARQVRRVAQAMNTMSRW